MQTTSSLSIGDNREAGDNRGETDVLEPRWSPRIVYMRTDVKSLASLLIPFAVFKENPLLPFQAAIPNASIEHATEAVQSLWNQPFAGLAEAQRYFLVAWSAVPGVSARVVPVAELAFGIATPGPYYKRWITTCAARYSGEPVAWCIEVDMQGEQEEVIEIVLSEGNMRRLLPSQIAGSVKVA